MGDITISDFKEVANLKVKRLRLETLIMELKDKEDLLKELEVNEEAVKIKQQVEKLFYVTNLQILRKANKQAAECHHIRVRAI